MMTYQTPHLCYCQIPQEKLIELARQRFVEGIPTEVLMKRLSTLKEREYLAAISLLDVQAERLAEVIPAADRHLLMHLMDCRFHVRCVLRDAGIHVEEN